MIRRLIARLFPPVLFHVREEGEPVMIDPDFNHTIHVVGIASHKDDAS